MNLLRSLQILFHTNDNNTSESRGLLTAGTLTMPFTKAVLDKLSIYLFSSEMDYQELLWVIKAFAI